MRIVAGDLQPLVVNLAWPLALGAMAWIGEAAPMPQ
jgi:hypothetical protein